MQNPFVGGAGACLALHSAAGVERGVKWAADDTGIPFGLILMGTEEAEEEEERRKMGR